MAGKTKKINLLFYTPIDLAYGAGFETWVGKITHLLKKEFNISIVFSDVADPKRWSDKLLRRKFAVSKLLRLHFLNFFSQIFLPDGNSLAKLYREFKKNDIVYFNCTFVLNDLLVVLISIISKTKVIFGFHAPVFYENKLHNLYFRLITFNLLRFVKEVHVLNSHDEKYLKKFTPNISKIPAFLSSAEMPKQNVADFRGKFLFVGRFDFQKGLDLLVTALAKIFRIHERIKFVFFGSGPQRAFVEQLQKKYPKNVELNEFENDKKKIYSKRKFILLSSRFETFPAVLIEAMSYGLPVITTRIPGAIDIVTHGKNGFYISNPDENGIEKTVSRAVLLPKKIYNKMSKNAFLQAQKYSDKIFKQKFSFLIKKNSES
ncbi:hypothetical protein A2774_03110 [Candidatus Roizmanbacteria bacterium RIFCSPHIGHO2_01_FULL_39_12c]|uniref:Glycosyl transferase family 1 domain-containing protein n=1 Tax=Candidatus Roizmanbacteria bacterium RIFCSPHIGHO2_01_FULL_39_12c TaxID=1802031 RepID=A0A1F7GBU9_9BACT|nr:MAG: hypothetical protein A2774_03110 [Candidatus Roizmanbacteria bacterium RIFCSPHIGHO2_01_FULL_39_12c]OGK47411.1 MAG: hypothetical protein A2963_04630 [Candidatus Roizmanbacteria bacterium RIFCSPLOWO2_01_FULL_40_13]